LVRLGRRAVPLIGGTLAALALAGSRFAIGGYARRSAEHSALTVATYLSLVTPPTKDSSDYDLGQLLIRARALETLPGWSPEIEIYHPTGPLVNATAPPLAPEELRHLRDEEAVRWRRGTALAPLPGPRAGEIVGAVAVRAPPMGPGWPGGLGVPALLVTLALGVRAARVDGREPRVARRAWRWYWAAGLLLGIGAYVDVRMAAHQARDRWSSDTRALVQEAARQPGHPTLTDLGRIAWGGTLVPAESLPGDSSASPLELVRLGAGRWAELRGTGGQEGSARWLLWTLSFALLGPAFAWSVGRVGRGFPTGSRRA